MKTRLILPAFFVFMSVYSKSIAQACTVNCPANIIIKADNAKGGTNVNYAQAATTGECGLINYTPASGSFFKVGSSSVIVSSASGQRCSFTVTVTDNEAPLITPLVFSTQRLWPANGKIKDVGVFYKISDNADSTSCVLTVSSNDVGVNGGWEVVNNHLVRLKASRLPDGRPRVYTITASCTDAAGNMSRRSKTISVAKNVNKKG